MFDMSSGAQVGGVVLVVVLLCSLLRGAKLQECKVRRARAPHGIAA